MRLPAGPGAGPARARRDPRARGPARETGRPRRYPHPAHRRPHPRFWAPWRSDPRPLEGLLHGAYAHLALAGYWQRAALYGARGAWAQHARIRAQVAAALPVIRACPELTPAGREFTDAMAAAEKAMDELRPPGDQYATARRALDRERRAWCAAHPELSAFIRA